jgi:hypothetical protein
MKKFIQWFFGFEQLNTIQDHEREPRCVTRIWCGSIKLMQGGK